MKCVECGTKLLKNKPTRYCCDGIVCSNKCKNNRFLKIQQIDTKFTSPNKWDEWLGENNLPRNKSMIFNIPQDSIYDDTNISDNEIDVSDNKIDISDNEIDVPDNKIDISDNEIDISDNETYVSDNDSSCYEDDYNPILYYSDSNDSIKSFHSSSNRLNTNCLFAGFISAFIYLL